MSNERAYPTLNKRNAHLLSKNKNLLYGKSFVTAGAKPKRGRHIHIYKSDGKRKKKKNKRSKINLR